MRLSKLLFVSLLLIYMSASFSSEEKAKANAIIDKKGPIAQATGLLDPLVALVAAYRGPVYHKDYYRVSNNHPSWFYHKFYYPPRSYFSLYQLENNWTLSVWRVYKRKKSCGAMNLRVDSFDPDSLQTMNVPRLAIGYQNDPTDIDDQQKQEALQKLNAQEKLTEQMRQEHGEISWPTTPEVAACEINGKIIVATAEKSIEVWPLAYGDFEKSEKPAPETSSCAIS